MNRFPWRLLAAASWLLVVPATAHADWLYYGGSPQHTGVASEALAAPLTTVWKYAALIQKPSTNATSPVVAGNVVYFVAADHVYAVRADTGELVWKTPSGDQPGPTTYHSTPVVANDTVYVGAANGHMYALDARNGAQKWEYITGAPIRSHPLVEENTLYFGSDDDYFYAIDANTGVPRWKFHGTADIESAATFAPGSTELIYFSSSDGHLYGLIRQNGKLKWSARTTAASGGNSPVAFQNALYLAAGNQIFSFRTRSGITESLIQATPAEAPEGDITCTPIFAQDPHDPSDPTRPVVYFGDRAGNFYCYQKSRSYWKRVWKQTLDGGVNAMPVMAGGVVFAAANKGFVYALNALDGSLLWQYHNQATLDLQSQYKYFNMDSPLVVAEGHLLVLGDDGSLSAFGPDGIDFTGPVLTQPRPTRGSMINGLPPLNIGAYVWDDGSGVNPQSIHISLDGRLLEPSKQRYSERREKSGVVYDPVQRRVMYNSPESAPGQRAAALPNGRHSVRIDAADWKGNPSTLEWSFVVDNTLPARPRVPADQNGQPGVPGYGAPGTPGYGPPGYGNPGYGNTGNRGRGTPRRPPLRGQQPGYGQPGYGQPGAYPAPR